MSAHRFKPAEVERLGSTGILQGLAPEEIAKILGLATRREARSGEVIFREGDSGDALYLLLAGSVDVTKNLTLKLGDRDFAKAEKSMVKIDAERAPLFGEMALLAPEPRSATITAAAPCVLCEIGKPAFDAFCESEPRLALVILRRIAVILAARLRKGNEDVLKLSTALSIALSR